MLLIYTIIAIVFISNLHYVRDIIKRRKTIARLKRLADEVNAKIIVHKNPYFSILRLF